MAQEKISALPVEALEISSGDFMLISKDIGGGLFDSEKIRPENIIYDSGWKDINDFNGAFGMAPVSAVYKPSIRVINRTVYLAGFYVIPMDDGFGGLDNNPLGYPSQYRELAYSGIPDGFNLGTKAEITTNNPIIPSALFPQVAAINNIDYNNLFRTYNPSGAIGRTRLNTLASVFILTDGRLLINSVETQERNGQTNPPPFWAKTSQPREIVSIFNIGDKIMDYSAWINSFTAGGVNQRVYTDTGDNYDFTHDSTQGKNLGGYSFRFSMNWSLDPLLSIDQIIAAFDSI